MRYSRLIVDFGDRASMMAAVADLVGLTEDAARELGFDYFAILHSSSLLRLSGAFIRFDNYPADWERRLVGRGQKIVDPVLLFARRRLSAFPWPDALGGWRLSSAQRAILEEAHRRGIRRGVTVPANIPGEPEGSITFAARRSSVIGRERVLIADAIGRIAFEAARRLAGLSAADLNAPHISTRVRECIYWIASGKTDQDVADILGIGVETVRTYVKSAFRLLNVITRGQMIHEALRLGLIDFIPPIPPFG